MFLSPPLTVIALSELAVALEFFKYTPVFSPFPLLPLRVIVPLFVTVAPVVPANPMELLLSVLEIMLLPLAFVTFP